MGIFGGIGKALKGHDFGDRLLAAGAIVNGDYGTAGQIRGLQRQRRDERDQQQAAQQQHEQLVAAAVQAGIPEQQARALPPQTLATALAQRIQPQGEEFTYFDDNAGNRWRQNTRTGQVDTNPTFVDRNPRQFMQDGQLITVPNSYAGGGQQSSGYAQQQGGTPPPEAVQALRQNPQLSEDFDRKYGPGAAARVMGGGASNGAGNFPGFQRIPGGQFRF